MKRFELGYGIAVEVYEEGDGKYAPRQVVLTAPDTEPFGIPGRVAAALCAALIECGYGPAVGVCRWTQTGDAEYPCFSVGCCNQSDFVAPGPETGNFCPYCGKRIEVVR